MMNDTEARAYGAIDDEDVFMPGELEDLLADADFWENEGEVSSHGDAE